MGLNKYAFEDEAGTISFKVNARVYDSNDNATVNETYLNSSYCDEIYVTKLATPTYNIVDGNLTWKTPNDNSSAVQNGTNIYYYSQAILDESQDPARYITNGGATDSNKNIGIGLSEDSNYNVSNENLIFKYYVDLCDSSKLENYDYSTYSYQQETSKYAEGEHTLETRFIGEVDLNYSGNNSALDNFYLSSTSNKITFNKLAAPQISMSAVTVGSEINRLEWKAIDNASGYNLLVTTKNMFGYSVVLYPNIHENNTYYSIDGNTCYFEIDHILEQQNITYYFFVQSIGQVITTTVESVTTNSYYTNSSFSDYKAIALPVTPSQFTIKDGEATWKVITNDASIKYNIGLTLTYEISNTQAHYDQVVSESDPSKLGYDIQSREVTVSGDKKIVVDKITLKYEDNKDENQQTSTPLRYKLTNIGTYTHYEIYSILIDSGSQNNSSYKSDNASGKPVGSYNNEGLQQGDRSNYIFNMFESGDGSEGSPYAINNSTYLNNIKFFTDRHFKVIDNIVYDLEWVGIDDKFTGSIDGAKNGAGDNYTITFTNMAQRTVPNGSNQYITFIRENSGTIKNIDFAIDLDLTVNEGDSTNLYMSSVAMINNEKGKISNVNTYNALINDGTDGVYIRGMYSSLYVGGLVYSNAGTIEDCSNNLTIVSINTRGNSYGAGIVIYNNNSGVISGCSNSGDITATNIGGLVYSATDMQSIEDCSVGKNDGNNRLPVVLTGISYYGSENNYSSVKSTVGGLVGVVSLSNSIDYTPMIYNCSVNANLVFDIVKNNGYFVDGENYYYGALIGFLDLNSDLTIKDTATEVTFKTKSGEKYETTNFKGYYFTPNNDYISCESCTTKITVQNGLSVNMYTPSGVTDLSVNN